MELSDLITMILATWRITNLLVDDGEGGPYDLLHRIRWHMGIRYDEKKRVYGTNMLARAFTCFWCASVWVGVVVALLPRKMWFILRPFALSAGALLLKRQIS